RGGWHLMQSLPQQISKEMVIAIPMSFVVQGNDEQVGALKSMQGFSPGNSGIKHNGITQGATQTVEDGGAQQERLNAFGLLLQHFFKQIIQHEMVATSER